MKKFLLFLLGLSLLLGGTVSAATDCTTYCGDPENETMPENVVCYCNPLGDNTSLSAITDPIIKFIFNIAVVVVPVVVIAGAFFIATAAGNAERIDKGKKMILWSLVGFLIVLLSQGLSDLLYNVLGI
jgi:hypothetical protein